VKQLLPFIKMEGLSIFILFIGKVAIFGLFYFFLFLNNPLNFNYNQEVKADALGEIWGRANEMIDISDIDSVVIPQAFETPFKTLYDNLKKQSEKITPKMRRLTNLKNKLAELERRRRKLFEKSKSSNEENLRKEINEKTKFDLARRKELVKEIRRIEKNSKDFDYQTGMKLNQLKVEVAQISFNIAQKKEEIYNSRELLGWADDGIIQKLSDIGQRVGKLEKQKHHLNNSLIEELADYREHIQDVKNILLSSLNYFDFFYFSMITATTVGYGDISPSGRLARILVTIQSVASVFLVGFAVNRLSITRALKKSSGH
jgi:predicted  nucleic acid-binding Zn-ribbon protein